jgi:hypothetical protein
VATARQQSSATAIAFHGAAVPHWGMKHWTENRMFSGALGRWGQVHRVAQALQGVHHSTLRRLTIALVEGVACQGTVDGPRLSARDRQ